MLENRRANKNDSNDEDGGYDVKHMTLLPPTETVSKKHEYLVMLETSCDKMMRKTKKHNANNNALHHGRE